MPAETAGATGALPAGWHECMHPEHGVPYFFNTVTKQSQWVRPTSAAAVPLAPLPVIEQLNAARNYSPNTLRAVGNDLGGVGGMAASFGLPESRGLA